MTGNMSRLVGLVMMIGTIFGSPSMALADEFCQQLKAIVGNASSGFSRFRGEQVKTDDEFHYFSASGCPVGAVKCEIWEEIKRTRKGNIISWYRSHFPATGKTYIDAESDLGLRIAQCLNLTMDGDLYEEFGPPLSMVYSNSYPGVHITVDAGLGIGELATRPTKVILKIGGRR